MFFGNNQVGYFVKKETCGMRFFFPISALLLSTHSKFLTNIFFSKMLLSGYLGTLNEDLSPVL